VSDAALEALSVQVGEALVARGLLLATAESCTGGWVAAAVTAVAGSSAWFERGFVTYSNAAKSAMLGVEPGLIDAHGAVSEPVVRAMARGAVAGEAACMAVAISGVAGPGGGTPAKPVGTVCLAWAWPGGERAVTRHYSGDRESVRRQAVAEALEGVLAAASTLSPAL
jgi:nicotinamide-nucleotide amidase